MLRPIGLAVRHLFPGYFAAVMATGIVSIAAYLLQMRAIAWILFAVAFVAYLVLCALTFARVALYPGKLARDLASCRRGPGFLTSVAATCIVGDEVVLLLESPPAGLVFWLIGVGLWVVIIYWLLAAAITKADKPPLARALHGGWLVPVVATQSLAALGGVLGPEFPGWTAAILTVSLSVFLFGGVLYLVVIALLFRRLVFSVVRPVDITPPYWISMGAAAITTLAGSTLTLAAPSWPFLRGILPFVLGLALLFWATATWWLPLLVILSVWRHALAHYPLRYSPLDWDIVFPLGMYTTCTLQLAEATGIRLEAIAQCFVYLALAAWVVVFAGMWRSVLVRGRGRARLSRPGRPQIPGRSLRPAQPPARTP